MREIYGDEELTKNAWKNVPSQQIQWNVGYSTESENKVSASIEKQVILKTSRNYAEVRESLDNTNNSEQKRSWFFSALGKVGSFISGSKNEEVSVVKFDTDSQSIQKVISDLVEYKDKIIWLERNLKKGEQVIKNQEKRIAQLEEEKREGAKEFDRQRTEIENLKKRLEILEGQNEASKPNERSFTSIRPAKNNVQQIKSDMESKPSLSIVSSEKTSQKNGKQVVYDGNGFSACYHKDLSEESCVDLLEGIEVNVEGKKCKFKLKDPLKGDFKLRLSDFENIKSVEISLGRIIAYFDGDKKNGLILLSDYIYRGEISNNSAHGKGEKVNRRGIVQKGTFEGGNFVS